MQLECVRTTLLILVMTTGPATAARLQFAGDIPGDGDIHCGTNAPSGLSCPTSFIGTVTPSAGTLSGALVVGGSTLNLSLPNSLSPVFLTFAGGTDVNQIVGP